MVAGWEPEGLQDGKEVGFRPRRAGQPERLSVFFVMIFGKYYSGSKALSCGLLKGDSPPWAYLRSYFITSARWAWPPQRAHE